jgi:phage tail tape-measure protein
MQEIGTWETANGSVAAVLEFDSDEIDGNGSEEMPKWLSGALQGAAAGAATGAAAGPYGALIGAAAGGTIGGAAAYAQQSSEPKTKPSATGGAAATPAKPASTPSSAPSSAQANVIQALQQFAAVIPALVQLVASSKSGKESDVTDGASELTGDSDWGPESFEGAWTVP